MNLKLAYEVNDILKHLLKQNPMVFVVAANHQLMLLRFAVCASMKKWVRLKLLDI